MPCPSYSPWFDYPNNIWSEYKSRSSSLCSLVQSPVKCISFSTSYSLTSPTYVLLGMWTNFHTHIKVHRTTQSVCPIQKQILHIITQNHTIRPHTCNSPVQRTLPKPIAFTLLIITKTVPHFAPVKAQCFNTVAVQFILLSFNVYLPHKHSTNIHIWSTLMYLPSRTQTTVITMCVQGAHCSFLIG